MLKQKARLIAVSLCLSEAVLLVLSFLSAYWLRDNYFLGEAGPLAPMTEYLWLLYVVVPLWLILMYCFRLYESQRTKSLWRELWKIAQLTLFGTCLLMAFVFLSKTTHISRLLVVFLGGFSFFFLAIERIAIRLWARIVRRKGYNYRNILIVGTGRRAREMQDLVEVHKEWGLRLIGFVSEHAENRVTHIKNAPVLGHVSELPRLLEAKVVDELVFAISRKHLEGLEEIFLLCEEQGIRTRVAINFFPNMIAKVHLEEFHGVPLLTFTTTPHNEFLLLAKRGFDIGISLLLLLFFFPVILLIAVAIKLSSKGPILFRQTRIGLNGRQFTFYKFRSMCQDAEDMKSELAHLNEMKGPAFKLKDDPRVTCFGAFLRRTSLDELPQLYNVLLGHMSIVGPRPPLPEEVKQYKRWQRRRLSMKPGLTCLWQIGGRNTITDFKKWMELDLRYIDNWSLKLDFQIFLKTILVVLAGRGAS